MNVLGTSLRFALLALLLFCCYDATCFAQTNTHIQLMDPETIYSFRGLDGEGFLTRKPINIPEPAYDLKHTGIVVLRFTINPAGEVTHTELEPNQVSLATPGMIISAQKAVSAWKFNPLPANKPQEDDIVRVLIQFNYKGSNRLFSEEGTYIIEGLGYREAINLPAPQYNTHHQGMVTAEAMLAPSGKIAFVDRYYGSQPGQHVVPHLGLATHEAIEQWRFTPAKSGGAHDGEHQKIKIICRYLHWAESPAHRPHARVSPGLD